MVMIPLVHGISRTLVRVHRVEVAADTCINNAVQPAHWSYWCFVFTQLVYK